MRLAIICGSLEPGRDGVGDYSRRLAGEFIRQGHPCALLAIHDPYSSQSENVAQEVERTSVPTLRLSAQGAWGERVAKARGWLQDFKPEWASFQFVPFAFHPKGLCFGLGKHLASLNSEASWQIMFHELWLGLGQNAPLKDRVYGVMQRRIAMDVVNRLRPRVISTQAEPYRRVLRREKLDAQILPLFGNIPNVHLGGWDDVVAKALGGSRERSAVYLAGILGGVHPEWSIEAPLASLLPLVQREQKELVLVFFGKNGLSADAVNSLKLTVGNRAGVVFMGERSDVEISKILNTLDLGLATSPRQMIQKSGSAAAMLEHGLTLLVTRNDWRLREGSPPADEAFPRLLSPEQFAALDALPMRDPNPPQGSSVKSAAERMLASFNGTVPAARPEALCAS